MTGTAVSPDIFRAYDIRGIAGEGLTDEVMTLLGKAIASEALDQRITTLIVGRDARLSSPAFHAALLEGILGTGCHVVDIGIVPTPVLYFATHTLKANSGLMITGSHNPGEYNGLKIVFRRECLADQQITLFRTRIETGAFHDGKGQLTKVDVVPAYMERIHRDLALKQPFKVVIDAGNGVAGSVAPSLFRALNCKVVPLYCEPDGHFPHHHPDPTIADNLTTLIDTVKQEQADLGIALDGDGDRVNLVTASGRILDADKLLMCFVLDILPENPGAQVVFDVKSSYHLPRLISAYEGSPVICKSGHSFVKRKMLETDALLGGEYSAHLFFRHRWYGFDDGMYAAVRFLELMQKYDSSADDLLDNMPASVTTPELGIAVPDNRKFSLMGALTRDLSFPDAHLNLLDGLRADFTNGWGLIRASNTTPKLVLRFEADTEDHLKALQEAFRKELSRVQPDLQLPF